MVALFLADPPHAYCLFHPFSVHYSDTSHSRRSIETSANSAGSESRKVVTVLTEWTTGTLVTILTVLAEVH